MFFFLLFLFFFMLFTITYTFVKRNTIITFLPRALCVCVCVVPFVMFSQTALLLSPCRHTWNLCRQTQRAECQRQIPCNSCPTRLRGQTPVEEKNVFQSGRVQTVFMGPYAF